jgi:tetratricopeptide (TPR) repeat protein
MHRQAGDQHGEPSAHDTMAFAYRGLGRHAEAAACYRRAIRLLAELGFEYKLATILLSAGDAYQDAGDVPAARDAWQQALEILEKLQHRDRTEAQARLSGTS